MKKFMMMALLAVAANSAFAQDALKEILKCKDYSQAAALVQSNLSSLNDEQKAKAYNKLVEISKSKVDKEIGIIQENQMMAQMGQKGDKPVDNAGMYEALAKALNDAMECDKYDNLPNAKGKISPKFHKKNQDGLWNLRTNLVNAGQDALQADDNANALKYFGLYVETATAPLFAEIDKTKTPDLYLGEVARVAGTLAYQQKDEAAANKYIDIALTDTTSYKEALNVKMVLMQQAMKTREDSVACVSEFEKLYRNDSQNENLFANLVSLLGSLGQTDRQAQLISDRLAHNPNDFMALATKGQMEMQASKWDEAIADFKAAAAVKDDALILTWMAYCNNNKAAGMEDMAKQKAILEETCGYLEKARQLDPNQERANWKYLLYNIYYNLYGENDARTKEVAQ